MATKKNGHEMKNFFMNWTKSCTIGLDPSMQRDYHADKLKDKPVWEREQLWPDGRWCFLPPGAVWNDSSNMATPLAERHANRFFVRCEDEDEIKIIKEAVGSAMGDIVKDETGKVRGFFGFFAVMRDVTRQHNEIMSKSVSFLSSEQHVDSLRKKAEAADKAVEEAGRFKSEAEIFKKQVEDLKRELAAEKAMAVHKAAKVK